MTGAINKMKYQLVLQFRADSIQDFDRLTAFEESLTDALGDLVDGHDFGSGEFNIFLITDDALSAFEKINVIAKKERLSEQMKAAYRDLTREAYVIVWPPGLKEFKIA
jgi:predicted RNA methylase